MTDKLKEIQNDLHLLANKVNQNVPLAIDVGAIHAKLTRVIDGLGDVRETMARYALPAVQHVRDGYKFSVSVRVDAASPSHVHFSMFAGLIPAEGNPLDYTRGKMGDVCLRVEEFGPFIARLDPDFVAYNQVVFGEPPEIAGFAWKRD